MNLNVNRMKSDTVEQEKKTVIRFEIFAYTQQAS